MGTGIDDGGVDDAVRALYATPPEQFLTRRAALADEAKTGGDAAAAREIAKLRKPTVAAWIVNALVHADDTAVTRIGELGDGLRTAQQALDAKQLRELAAQRRTLVAGLTAAALDEVGRTDASTTLQDEIRGTFDAAVADPGVAARLGRLQRAESFSGFGFDEASGPPQLTLVRGGKSEPATPARSAKRSSRTAEKTAEKTAKPADSKRPTRADQARARALTAARDAAEAADAEVGEARGAEKQAAEQVRTAEQAVADARAALADAKSARDAAREAHRQALTRRRTTRRELDRITKGR